jgi:hypothetical protein
MYGAFDEAPLFYLSFIFRVLLSCHAMNFAEFLHSCLILLLKFRKREHLGG